MRTNILLLAVLAFWFVAASAQAQNIVLLNGVEVDGQTLLVKTRAGVAIRPFDVALDGLGPDATAAMRSLAQAGVLRLRPLYPEGFANPQLAAGLGMDRTFVVELAPGREVGPAMNGLAAMQGLFEIVEPNSIVRADQVRPNDPRFDEQWALRNTGQFGGTTGADIRAETAWGVTTGRATVRIAILDTGLDAPRAWPRLIHEEFTGGRIVAGRNFTTPDRDDWVDRRGHGTHVAGIAAARGDNGLGIAGVCWTCSLIIGKVLDDEGGSGTMAEVSAGLQWATDVNADVINMSLSTPAFSAVLRDSCRYAWGSGVLLVAASGNSGIREERFPAAYGEVIAVGSTRDDDRISVFSTRGAHLELSAPGEDILSTEPGCFGCPQSAYGFRSGTSMAAPHVAGVAALVLSTNPGLTNIQVRDVLAFTAVDLGVSGRDEAFGFGRMDAGRALLAAQQQTIWVDFAYSGPMDGSFLRPYNRLSSGVNAAPCGGTVRVIGSSSETGTFSRPAGCSVNIESWGGSVTIGQ